MTDHPPEQPSRPFVLAIASGKGGTGKTFVATNLSSVMSDRGESVVLTDCDAEAPNDHLFLTRSEESVTPVEVLVAEVDRSICTGCGRCRACAYGAVRVLGGAAVVFEEMCHGCGLCTDVCRVGAVSEVLRHAGDVIAGPVGGHDRLRLVSGRLKVGQVKTPAVIRAAREAAESSSADLLVLDAPPGVACAAVAAIRGADALLLVTEPTPFGQHDLELSLRLGRDLGLPTAVVINRDRGDSAGIEQLCRDYGAPIVARIPFDRGVAETYARGDLVSRARPESADTFANIHAAMTSLAALKKVTA